MRNELIFLILIGALAGCGGSGETSSGGGSLIDVEAKGNSTVNLTIDGDIESIDARANDQGVVNIDQNEAGGIPLNPGNLEPVGLNSPGNSAAENCESLGGELITDSRGTVCSDGRGGTIPLGSEG